MDIQRKKGLLDVCVLAVLRRGPSYGYKIIGEVSSCIEVSESTLYPVLRRLQKDECLEAYDREFAGRNRRYYRITPRGSAQLNLYMTEWKEYSARINRLFTGRNET